MFPAFIIRRAIQTFEALCENHTFVVGLPVWFHELLSDVLFDLVIVVCWVRGGAGFVIISSWEDTLSRAQLQFV